MNLGLDTALPFEAIELEYLLQALQQNLSLVAVMVIAVVVVVALRGRRSSEKDGPTRLSLLQEALESISSHQEKQDIIRAALSFAATATGARIAAMAIGQANEANCTLYCLFEGQLRVDRVGMAVPSQPASPADASGDKRDKRENYRPLCVVPSHYPKLKKALGIQIRTAHGETGEIFVANKSEPFCLDDEATLALLARQVTLHLEHKVLFQQVNGGYMETIEALVNAIEAKDAYTRGHSDRVTKYAVAIAREMGLPAEQVDEIRVGAVLHDIGKIGVPERVINKPGRLDDDEWRLMKDHPRLATKIIDSFNRSREILLMIYHHHEMYDGTGYPAGLRGSEIPQSARILKVADAFEAMTSHRPYQKSKTVDQALQELKAWSGRQFDPLVVSAFLRALGSQDLDLPKFDD